MTPEKTVENKIRHNVQNIGGWIVKFFASPNTNKGVPDLLSVINGHFCAFEVKRPIGGKPTPIQLWHLQQIANAGGIALVTNDPQIVDIINDHTQHHTKNIKLRSTKECHIDQITLSQQPDVKTATHLWQKTKKIHTLQILPSQQL